MNKFHRVGTVTFFVSILVVSSLACSAPSAATPTPGITETFPLPDTAVPTVEAAAIVTDPSGSPGGADLTVEQLRNMTYQLTEGVQGGTVTLVDGHFSVYDAGVQADITIDFEEPVAFGDLNGDGVPDAVVLLGRRAATGVSNHSISLIAVLNQNGVPQQAGSLPYLGLTPVVKSLTIVDGIIVVDMNVVGPNDGMCCPNTPETKKLKLEGTQLIQVP